jgi:zinc and cadmium transporter
MNEPAWTPVMLLAGYSLLVLLASLAGGWIPMVVRLTHTRLQVATSVVAGLMLGVGVLHLMPHAFHEMGSIDRVAGWILGGFLLMFFLQRFFHFHHHDVPDEDPEGCDGGHAACGSHGHGHGHGKGAPAVHHDHTLAGKSASHLSWWGAALGLTLHSLIDGVALGASVAVESQHGVGLAGVGTFLVIVLHKPFDAMVIGTLMKAGGWSRVSRQVVNGLFALAIPVGVMCFHLGAEQLADTPAGHLFLGAALAFAAGTFLCIAASDLLPELQFHSHDRVRLSVAMAVGIFLAVVIGKFESSGHDDANHAGEHDHDHDAMELPVAD